MSSKWSKCRWQMYCSRLWLDGAVMKNMMQSCREAEGKMKRENARVLRSAIYRQLILCRLSTFFILTKVACHQRQILSDKVCQCVAKNSGNGCQHFVLTKVTSHQWQLLSNKSVRVLQRILDWSKVEKGKTCVGETLRRWLPRGK